MSLVTHRLHIPIARSHTPVRVNSLPCRKATNPTFGDIGPKNGQFVEIWGVVVTAVKQFRT